MLSLEDRTDVGGRQLSAGFDVLIEGLTDRLQIFGVSVLDVDSFPEGVDEVFEMPAHGLKVIDNVLQARLCELSLTEKYLESSGKVDSRRMTGSYSML